MATEITIDADELTAQVSAMLKASGWNKYRFTSVATGSFYICKTFAPVGPAVGLHCDWKFDGPLHVWPVSTDPERIVREAQELVAAAVYPAITFLTNSGGEHNEDDLPEVVVKQVPFEDGPGDVRPYLVRIERDYYVLGNLEVSYQYPIWDGLELPTQDVVTKACEAAISHMRAKSAPGVIVYPLDFDDMPGRCVISVALPVREDSRATMKERLANAFCGFEDTDKLLALAA